MLQRWISRAGSRKITLANRQSKLLIIKCIVLHTVCILCCSAWVRGTSATPQPFHHWKGLLYYAFGFSPQALYSRYVVLNCIKLTIPVTLCIWVLSNLPFYPSFPLPIDVLHRWRKCLFWLTLLRPCLTLRSVERSRSSSVLLPRSLSSSFRSCRRTVRVSPFVLSLSPLSIHVHFFVWCPVLHRMTRRYSLMDVLLENQIEGRKPPWKQHKYPQKSNLSSPPLSLSFYLSCMGFPSYSNRIYWWVRDPRRSPQR